MIYNIQRLPSIHIWAFIIEELRKHGRFASKIVTRSN